MEDNKKYLVKPVAKRLVELNELAWDTERWQGPTFSQSSTSSEVEKSWDEFHEKKEKKQGEIRLAAADLLQQVPPRLRDKTQDKAFYPDGVWVAHSCLTKNI